MKLAIVGYGKMGHIIEKIAESRGHEVVVKIDKDNRDLFMTPEFRDCDVAIEFTTPATAVENILESFAAGVPVVCGTTGWYDSLPEMKQICEEGKGTLLYASNFSVGVNIFVALNAWLARVMNNCPEYTPHLVETHHIHKLDHPSGTAITLAETLIGAHERLEGWCEPEGDKECPRPGFIEIDHVRSGEVPGIHTIVWDSPADSISLTHSAKSREGFALGAVLAAEWLKGKSGIHTIDEVFKF